MKKCQGAIRKIGIPVRVEDSSGSRSGRAVLYPMRVFHKEWGGVEYQPEGRSEPGRFVMFCEEGLLKGVDDGCVFFAGEHCYRLVWKDETVCRFGGYIKACLRLMTKEE